jgi:hypothetical protein
MGGWHLGNFQIRAQIIFPTRRSVSSEQESAHALNLRFSAANQLPFGLLHVFVFVEAGAVATEEEMFC